MVVDDHEVVRAGLVSVLAQEPNVELVGTASTGREAVDLACREQPDVAIVDLRLPDTSGDKRGTPTPQQARVLELAAEGLTYREIARRLVVSEAAVRFHIQNLKLKYGAASKTELIVQAIRMGLVIPPGHEATQ